MRRHFRHHCHLNSLAFLMTAVLVLLFSTDLELYGDDGGDSGGHADDDVKIPTRYPPGSRRPPAAVTAAPTMMTPPPAPITTRRTTRRPPPPSTPSLVVSARPPAVTTRKPTPAPVTTTTSKRMTKPPHTPPTPAPVTTTTAKRATSHLRLYAFSPHHHNQGNNNDYTPKPPPPPSSKRPQVPQSSIKPQSILCTFGNRTNYGTISPADALCDYSFYDSMYKNNKNPLVANWDYDMYSILSKARKTDPTKMQFGLGFAFERRRRLVQDLVNSSLEVFWEHNVFRFGILYCPAHGTKQADMDDVFVALKALDDTVRKARATGNASYIVLVSVTYTYAWNNYFKDKFENVFKPDLFISLAHQLRGDPQKSRCLSTPPTILEEPQGLSDAHDLYDAAQSLASINSLPGAPRLSISVSMKGRWSTLMPTSRVEVISPCEKGTPGLFFGSYTEICNTPPFSVNVLHEVQRYAMRTCDPGTRRMFVHDDEQALCQKLCLVKTNHTNVPFGVTLYDVDYEDTDNTCAYLNLRDDYSHLKIVRSVANFFANKFTDLSEEGECSALYL